MKAEPTLICILGPTAVGKTQLAIQLAKHFSTEIISADSRQFYKEVSIGTAKPDAEEMQGVKHHFINSHSVTETYSAGDFARDALTLCSQLFAHKDVVILVGGSGMYVRALLNGLDVMPQADEQLRISLHQLYESQGIEALQQLLKNLDEKLYEKTELKNPQRVMRAIEIAKSGSGIVKTEYVFPYRVIKIILDLPREELYDRINRRVDAMIHAGLEAEARSMLPYRNTYAMQTVGYTEWFVYFDGKISREKAIELIKQHTRNYAKRQLTWFRKEKDAIWVDARTDLSELIKQINYKLTL
jgi:tRNA dimethylallyltransferase